MNKIRTISLFAILGCVFVLLSCNQDNSSSPPPMNTITIRDDFFDPANITVGVGRPIIWRHMGNHQHTVTSGTPTVNPGTLFDSGALNPGGGFQFILNAPGSYPYFCKIHGIAMTGTITVQ